LITPNTCTSVTGAAARGIIVVPEDNNLNNGYKVHTIQLATLKWTHYFGAVLAESNIQFPSFKRYLFLHTKERVVNIFSTYPT